MGRAIGRSSSGMSPFLEYHAQARLQTRLTITASAPMPR